MSENVRLHVPKYSSNITINHVFPWGQTGYKMFILMTFIQVSFFIFKLIM